MSAILWAGRGELAGCHAWRARDTSSARPLPVQVPVKVPPPLTDGTHAELAPRRTKHRAANHGATTPPRLDSQKQARREQADKEQKEREAMLQERYAELSRTRLTLLEQLGAANGN